MAKWAKWPRQARELILDSDLEILYFWSLDQKTLEEEDNQYSEGSTVILFSLQILFQHDIFSFIIIFSISRKFHAGCGTM